MFKEIIFTCSILFCLFLYRSIVSVKIISKKTYIIDEQSYVIFAYLSFVCLMTVLTKNINVGVIFLATTPIFMIAYFMIVKVRVYWIVNGVNTNLASYGNALIEKLPKFADSNYMKEHIIFRKVENKIKVNIENLNYQEKEEVLKIIKEVAIKHTKEVNSMQIFYLLINVLVCLASLLSILLII